MHTYFKILDPFVKIRNKDLITISCTSVLTWIYQIKLNITSRIKCEITQKLNYQAYDLSYQANCVGD